MATATAGSRIATLLVEEGQVDQDQLAYARRVQGKLAAFRPLVAILRDLGYVDDAQIRITLQARRRDLSLDDLLREFEVLPASALQSVLASQPDADLGHVLVATGLLSEDTLLEALSRHLGLPFLRGDRLDLDQRLVARLGPDALRRLRAVPLRDEAGAIVLAVDDPLAAPPLDELTRLAGDEVVLGLARRHAIDDAVAAMTGGDAARIHVSEDEVARTVDDLIARAVAEDASDLHLEPLQDRLRVRMRRDGVLVPREELPRDLLQPLVRRLKRMAGVDVAAHRPHQEGRIRHRHGGITVELRASFHATVSGEKAVLRLPAAHDRRRDLSGIGMAPRMLARLREDVLGTPSGAVLVTGPAGSGKTATLYGAVAHLDGPDTSIVTAEDTVEQVLDGVVQCTVTPRFGATCDETLLQVVRQDPDLIVIDEIRDRCAADMAIDAALTGHAVLGTLRAADSIGGLLRLLHMGVDADLVASTVVAVVAQRLLRRVCPHCARAHDLAPDEIRRLGYNPAEVRRLAFRRGAGCAECDFLGHRGRIGVFEVLILDGPVRDALVGRRPGHELRRRGREHAGMVSLLEDGIVKAARGQTSYEEILRTLPRPDRPRPLADLRRFLGVT